MKTKLLRITAMMGVALFCAFSCRNDYTSLPEQVPAIDLNKIASVKNRSGEEQKTAYLLLNESEQGYIWKQQIVEFSQKKEINANQRAILTSLAGALTSDMFRVSTSEEVKKAFENKWVSQLLPLFTLTELTPIVAKLQSNPGATPSSARAASGCQCNGNSYFDCGTCGGGGGCAGSTSGCGFFFWYACNKSCGIQPQK